MATAQSAESSGCQAAYGDSPGGGERTGRDGRGKVLRSQHQYHVDLHLEVDPQMTVYRSHEIATEVRFKIREQLEWVADVLVHVEPHLASNHHQKESASAIRENLDPIDEGLI